MKIGIIGAGNVGTGITKLLAEAMHSGSIRIGAKGAGVFVTSDDAEAKRVVTLLVQNLGAEVTNVGPLTNARYIEPACYLIVHLAYARTILRLLALRAILAYLWPSG